MRDLLWKQEAVHKAQDFIGWSEVLDVRGLRGEGNTERLVEELLLTQWNTSSTSR